jgi:hypothetical protein
MVRCDEEPPRTYQQAFARLGLNPRIPAMVCFPGGGNAPLSFVPIFPRHGGFDLKDPAARRVN